MTAAPPRRFTHRGKRSYTSEADWLFLRDMTVKKKVVGGERPHCYFGRGAWCYECNNLYSFCSENRKAGQVIQLSGMLMLCLSFCLSVCLSALTVESLTRQCLGRFFWFLDRLVWVALVNNLQGFVDFGALAAFSKFFLRSTFADDGFFNAALWVGSELQVLSFLFRHQVA